jgi:hypothetical protein
VALQPCYARSNRFLKVIVLYKRTHAVILVKRGLRYNRGPIEAVDSLTFAVKCTELPVPQGPGPRVMCHSASGHEAEGRRWL